MSTPTTPDLQTALASEIRAEMGRQRKTGMDLARHLGCSQQSASRILNGQTKTTMNTLASVAELLGVPPDVLVARSAAADRQLAPVGAG